MSRSKVISSTTSSAGRDCTSTDSIARAKITCYTNVNLVSFAFARASALSLARYEILVQTQTLYTFVECLITSHAASLILSRGWRVGCWIVVLKRKKALWSF